MRFFLNKAFFLGFAALTWYGCARNTNENSKPTAVPVKLVTHKEAVDSLRKDTTAPLKALIVGPLSEKQLASFFGQHDVTPLLFMTDAEGGYANRFDGFYGADHYRIEFYFSEVRRDSLNPTVYYVKGKNRYKKNITPFEGTLKFEKLATFKDPNHKEESYDSDEFALKESYSAQATFELKENAVFKGSGVFSGQMFLDFYERKDGTIDLWYYSQNAPAQGSGFKFDGNWRNYKTNQTKPVVWAKDLFIFANDILTDFSIGERDVEINKKYRHLGWDNYWENDEWWHDTPTIQ